MTQPAPGPEVAPAAAPGVTLAGVFAANAQDDVFFTDKGNGRRFADTYRDVVRYVEDRDEWLVRTQPHWATDTSRLVVFGLTAGIIRAIRDEGLQPSGGELDDERRQRYEAFAMRTESEGARLRMISTAREHPALVVREDDLDADFDAVATPTGVVNLLTGEHRAARPDDLCTRSTTVAHDPDATSPLLDQYLDTFMPDPDDQRVLFAVLGTILRGGNPGRLFPIFLGGTTSGKSQLISALDRLLGGYVCTINASVFRGNLDDKPRPDLVRAMHHRVAYAVEASKVWELHADQVKRITGGDAVPYRDLFAKSIEKIPRFTPLIITNEMPRIKGADAALKRRILTVTFDKTLPPALEDTRVKERFIRDEGCLRALLARVVAGARDDLLRDGIRWSLMPTKYAAATLESFGKLDHVDEFIEWLKDREILEIVNMSETPLVHCARAEELHEWYTTWVNKHGDKQDKAESLSLRDLGRTLRERGWDARRSDGIRWRGVRLVKPVGMWGI